MVSSLLSVFSWSESLSFLEQVAQVVGFTVTHAERDVDDFLISGYEHLLCIDTTRNRRLADAAHPLGVFRYQTFSPADYDRFLHQYIRTDLQWAMLDFGKPGLERVACESSLWTPTVRSMWYRATLDGGEATVELSLPERATTLYGAPGTLFVTISLEGRLMKFDVNWRDKPAVRLPEACWFSFSPLVSGSADWEMKKLAQTVSPLDVVPNGNRHLHAVDGTISCTDQDIGLFLETWDAPLVAPGEPSLLNFHNDQPRVEKGMHFNLYNNVWGTNFPLWFGEPARFRFDFRISP